MKNVKLLSNDQIEEEIKRMEYVPNFGIPIKGDPVLAKDYAELCGYLADLHYEKMVREEEKMLGI